MSTNVNSRWVGGLYNVNVDIFKKVKNEFSAFLKIKVEVTMTRQLFYLNNTDIGETTMTLRFSLLSG